MGPCRVLVTGGAGYLGTTLVPILLQKGFRVTVLDNLMYGQCVLLECCSNPNFEFIKGDIRDFGAVKRLVGQSDVVPESDRGPSTRDLSNFPTVNLHRVVIAGDGGSFESFEADQFSRYTGFHLQRQYLAPDKFSFIELHDPPQTRLDKARRSVNIVAIKKQLRFEPQRVSRTQARREQAQVGPGFHHGSPH